MSPSFESVFDSGEPLLQVNPIERGRQAFGSVMSEVDCPFSREDNAIAFWGWVVGYRQEDYDGQLMCAKDECQGFFGEDEALERVSDLLRKVERAKDNLDRAIHTAQDEMPSAEEVSGVIAVHLDDWPLNCFAIACIIYRAGLFPGFRPVYGDYHGLIHPDSPFKGRSFARHGWLQNDLGVAIDPTRFVFLNDDPFIWIGPHDFDLDIGGERRKTYQSDNRPPAFSSDEKLVALQIDLDATPEFQSILPDFRPSNTGVSITQTQAFWLANQPPAQLRTAQKAIYAGLRDANMAGLIPVDYVSLTDPEAFTAKFAAS